MVRISQCRFPPRHVSTSPPCTRGGRGAGAARPALEKASHGLTNLRLTLIFHHSQVRQSSRCPSLGQPRPRAPRPAPTQSHQAFGEKSRESAPRLCPATIHPCPAPGPAGFVPFPNLHVPTVLPKFSLRSWLSARGPKSPLSPKLCGTSGSQWADPALGVGGKKFGFASTGAGRKGFLACALLEQLRVCSGSVRASSCRACPGSCCAVTPNPRPSFSFPMQRGASNCCSREGKPRESGLPLTMGKRALKTRQFKKKIKKS